MVEKHKKNLKGADLGDTKINKDQVKDFIKSFKN